MSSPTDSPTETSSHSLSLNRNSYVDRFLDLVAFCYPKADLATCFMEQRRNLSNISGIANMRDTLSHLVTLLDPSVNEEDKEAQLHHAEEHFRRAIIEPYQVTVEDLVADFRQFYEKYEQEFLPAKDRYLVLKDAPDRGRVDATLREVAKLTTEGRKLKGRNRLDEEWERGVMCFVDAFDKLHELFQEAKGYYYNFRQLTETESLNKEIRQLHQQIADHEREGKIDNKKQTILTVWGIVATLLLGVLPLVLLLKPSLVTYLRRALGLE